MALTILEKGFAATVQDLGRSGYQRFGIIVGGVMDPPAAKLANWLVANPETAALIEFSFMGPSVLFTDDTLFAVTGADCCPELNGRKIHTGKPYLARVGQILAIRGLVSGSRGYLAVSGGVDTPVWFGSRSTYMRAGMGGYKGRLLVEHDRIPVGKPSRLAEKLMGSITGSDFGERWFFSLRRIYHGIHTIRVMPDTLWARFTEQSRTAFLNEEYQVTASSDRMGYRLEGEALALSEPLEMYSEAVTNGSIQVPPGGQPIILMTDHQSTGGYPRIAQVASVDLPLLAQLPPNSRIIFQKISVEEAENLLLRKQDYLKVLRKRVTQKLESLVP
ncbi:biotin-dependent carboxyltransferase family protein [Sporolactobacillus shoreae]|uniref:Biotin-dependent carboxyltransferase family protein n=1 Tax=Sporolactobacillus shoreae TaxID=1465501 RepID=A0A4Z0GPY4_9BACL|nr:biotin-dependent carboxyltransferase family protein [Sporolactobacillus shoreae]TGA98736.1 biotin-dependent carboxyltransferase family protein [Sporolactobacillus shoreae]